MDYLGVDLAERYSAAILLTSAGSTLGFVQDFGQSTKPYDPWMHQDAINNFWHQIQSELWPLNKEELVIVVEDLSHGMVNPRAALITQGAFICNMQRDEFWGNKVLPTKWAKHFGYKKQPGVTIKAWAKKFARETYGYEAPKLPMIHGAERKALVDLTDAYLIARYASEAPDLRTADGPLS